MKLYNDKCENVLCQFDADSIEAMVCDPPGAINFMCKKWDSDMGGRDNWIEYMAGIFRECLRVLKPGAHALVWAIPRTSHWTSTALENAGFEVRDICHYLFGSGFPKSLNIGKAVDRLQGNERERTHQKHQGAIDNSGINEGWQRPWRDDPEKLEASKWATKGTSEWEGWGTALKPACEHWILVRKPLGEKTVAENVLKWGCGGLNIDGCRIEVNGNENRTRDNSKCNPDPFFSGKKRILQEIPLTLGRFPANVILDDSEVVRAGFPNTKSGGTRNDGVNNSKLSWKNTSKNIISNNHINASEGSAARFFYCAEQEKELDFHCCFCYIPLHKASDNNNNAKEQSCRDVNIVNKNLNLIENGKNIVQTDVADRQLPEKEDNQKKLQESALFAEKNLMSSNLITENIVLNDVTPNLKSKAVQLVKSVGNLCDLCAMNFVQEVVEIKHWDSSQEISQVILDFIGNYKKCFLIQNLVSYAEIWVNIDTTQITENLLKLFGSVLHVIKSCTQKIRKSEPSRFIYTPKASKRDRDEGLEGFYILKENVSENIENEIKNYLNLT